MPRPDMNDPHNLLLVDIQHTAAHPFRPLVERIIDPLLKLIRSKVK